MKCLPKRKLKFVFVYLFLILYVIFVYEFTPKNYVNKLTEYRLICHLKMIFGEMVEKKVEGLFLPVQW